MKPIKILGAGISGLTAGINLAKAGYKVEVCERNKDVGMRFGGDLQGLENWSEKEDILELLNQMNISINFDCDPFLKIIFTNSLKNAEITTKKPYMYLVKRGNFSGSLDDGLKKQAIEAGVEIRFESTIPQEAADIIATGPVLDWVPGMVKGIIFKTKLEDTAITLFNDKAAFKGYSYLLVTKGYGCMCTVVLSEFSHVNDCFKETKKIFSKMVKMDIQNPKNAGGVGCFSVKNTFKRNNNLFVGEAAGLQDVLWGFGMRYAFTSGFLAAQSIINNEDYEKKAKEKFSNKLKASLVNRFLREKASFGNYAFLIDRLKNSKDLFGSLYSFHNYNFLQKIISPFALSYTRKKYPNIFKF
jgi:flavin-dependent dehydrogenase